MELGNAVSGNYNHLSPSFFCSKRQLNSYIPGKERHNLHLFSGAAVSRKETCQNTKEKPESPWTSVVYMAALAMIHGNQEQALQVTTFSIHMHLLATKPTEK